MHPARRASGLVTHHVTHQTWDRFLPAMQVVLFSIGYGERGRNRTFNLLIKSQLLCQLSYAPDPEVLTEGVVPPAPHHEKIIAFRGPLSLPFRR